MNVLPGCGGFVLFICLDKMCRKQEISIDNHSHKKGQETLTTAFLAGKRIPPRGVEPLESKSQSQTNKALTENENSVFATGLDNFVQKYPDLNEVVEAWPDLPEDTRTAIKALIETHRKETT